MKKILVTGCNGQLGRAIRAEYAKEDVTFINTDVVEGDDVTALDIADVDAVLALVRAERPQVIINCAAHTNVDACETQWDAAYRINAIGPRNLAIEMCIRDRCHPACGRHDLYCGGRHTGGYVCIID